MIVWSTDLRDAFITVGFDGEGINRKERERRLRGAGRSSSAEGAERE